MVSNSTQLPTGHQLNPVSDAVPVVVTVEKELSGRVWHGRFLGSQSIQDLTDDDSFKDNVQKFYDALIAAGATVNIAATYRPPERAYLMHWSWKIVNNHAVANEIPNFSGENVNIKWDHPREDGSFSEEKSISAARDMVELYGMTALTVAPSLSSRHTEGKAIDMTIGWTGDLTIKDSTGVSIVIKTSPKDGTNSELAAVGAGYGVIKFNVPGRVDKPHWSTDGR